MLLGCNSQSFYQDFNYKKTINPPRLLNCDLPQKEGVLNYKYKNLEKSSENKSIYCFFGKQACEISVRITLYQHIQ